MRLRPAYRYRDQCRTPATYWIRYALAEPRDFAYAAGGRTACRILRRHNATCLGRPDHQHLRRRRTP